MIPLHVKDPKRYRQQHKFLTIPRQGSKRIHWSHYYGGRGCAKTTTGIMLAIRAMQEFAPGRLGLWTELIVDDIVLNFMPLWEDIVPGELYFYHKSIRVIEWLPTGSRMALRALHVENTKKEPGRGPNYAWAILDECAMHFDAKRIDTLSKAVRDPQSPTLFIATLSTPKCNGYQDLIEKKGHVRVHATSFDNPFLSQEWRDDLVDNTDDPNYYRQEILGEFIAQSGLVWPNWSNDTWPKGNVLQGVRHDKRRPYILAADIGLRSAWLVLQRHDSPGLAEPLLVCTAEYTPNDEPADRTLARIDQEYGAPSKLVVGADVTTRSIQTGVTAEYLVRQLWGSGVQILPITGDWADKELQYATASARILDVRGQRRFVIAEHMRSHDAHNHRGLREMFSRQTWPERSLRSAEFFERDKQKNPYIDACDAFCYASVGLHPPRMVKSKTRAA